MPYEGHKSISVPDAVYDRLKKKAEETCRTLPKYVEFLITEQEKREAV
jgi:macrodomain Ter protein organizer (MatP/YcbG family)